MPSAEEFPESILHRYPAIQRLDAVMPAFETLAAVIDDVLPDCDTVRAARDVVLAGHAGSARDAIHLATMRRVGSNEIMTFDSAFVSAAGVRRVR